MHVDSVSGRIYSASGSCPENYNLIYILYFINRKIRIELYIIV